MRWRKLLLSALVMLVTLELTLQVAALAVAMTRPAQPTDSASQHAVVCLGDSYTFGIGSTQPSAAYPAQLQSTLRALGHSDLLVKNGGCPGQNSAYMLRRLPSLLQADTKVLCLLMAFNDTWSPATHVTSNEDSVASTGVPAAFEWKWRTGRLVALCYGFFQNSWHRTSAQIAEQAAERRTDPAILDQAAGFDLLLQLGVLAQTPQPVSMPTACPAALQARIGNAYQLAAKSGAKEGMRCAEQVVADHADSPFALHALAAFATQAADPSTESKALARLEEMAGQQQPAAEECLMFALAAAGHNARALEVAKRITVRDPRSLLAWKVRQDAAFQLGDWEQFEHAASEGLRLADRVAPLESSIVARHYAQAIAPGKPGLAAGLMVAAALLDGDADMLQTKVWSVRGVVPWSAFADAIDRAAPSKPSVIEALRQRFRRAYDAQSMESDAWPQGLEANMLEAGRICKERGIRVVVIGYPFPHPGLEAVQRKVASQLSAPFVDVRERFDRELETRRREDLFVRDGHCSDAGYAILAELVSPVVSRLLSEESKSK
jgi:lysophospholipase L1-like esterase